MYRHGNELEILTGCALATLTLIYPQMFLLKGSHFSTPSNLNWFQIILFRNNTEGKCKGVRESGGHMGCGEAAG